MLGMNASLSAGIRCPVHIYGIRYTVPGRHGTRTRTLSGDTIHRLGPVYLGHGAWYERLTFSTVYGTRHSVYGTRYSAPIQGWLSGDTSRRRSLVYLGHDAWYERFTLGRLIPSHLSRLGVPVVRLQNAVSTDRTTTTTTTTNRFGTSKNKIRR